jgi:hypothetical protein
MAELLKIISVFLSSTVFFGKLAVPTAFVLKFGFLKMFIVCMAGGILGNIVFTYMSAAILKAIHNYRVMKGKVHRKKIFNRVNRTIIKVKRKFGLTGIAFVTPMFMSTPLGAFIAEKFFKDKKKIILYFTISDLFWFFVLYTLFTLFNEQINDWLH